eukprot:1306956-Pyramimonas_sp.AAC.1
MLVSAADSVDVHIAALRRVVDVALGAVVHACKPMQCARCPPHAPALISSSCLLYTSPSPRDRSLS